MMGKSMLGVPTFTARYFYRRAERRRERGRMAAAHQDLVRSARAGYVVAQYALAKAYQNGQGCMRSGALAEHWYRISAEAGNANAQFELGVILIRERGPDWAAGASAAWLNHSADQQKALVTALFPAVSSSTSDPAEALSWLRRAAEAGKPEAQANVGWLLLKGIGSEIDLAEAHRWLTAASTHDISQAALGLAEYYGSTDAANGDFVQSARWAQRASELGNGSGSRLYAIALRDGIGVSRNLAEAEKYFSLAVEQGHPTAGYEGAVLALARDITPAQVQPLIERLRLCAKRNHVPSAMLLADLYKRGDRVQPDPREAAYWYRAAADLGSVEAQFVTGCLYARGEGISGDLKHAARYFERAASGGHAQAAYNLGIFHLNGQGVQRSSTEAKRWFSVAADLGLTQAQLRLGQILDSEAVTSVETMAARALIERASDSGNGEAQVALARMLLSKGDSVSEQQAFELLWRAMSTGEVAGCELLLRKAAAGPDLAAVVEALHRAAQSGNTRAKFVLAEELLTGERVPQDTPAAIELLTEAAAARDAQAHFLLGVVFCQGKHVSKDVQQGYRHYLEAAQSNHPLGQYNTGVMLLHGIGVEKNVENGINWIRRAASNNVQKAVELVREFEQGALAVGTKA